MQPANHPARVAGALYLLAGAPAVFSIIYLPRMLIVPGNATATAGNILAAETLFRTGLVCELLSAVALIFCVRALSRLLDMVDQRQASLMTTLALVSVPIMFLNALNGTAALALPRGADFLSVFGQQQRDALAMLFLGLHRQGFIVAAIFWGLWLFPFGLLVMNSGFLPRILGVLLIAACFGYLAASLTSLLLPDYLNVVNLLAIILEVAGEGSIVAWLLIKGVKVQQLAAPTP